MARDGSVGFAEYEKVAALAKNGMTKADAIKAVAEDLGKSPASVQNNYYRIARQKTGGRRKPTSRTRRTAAAPTSRARRAESATPAGRSIDAITRELVTNIEQLTAAVKSQSDEVATLRGRLDRVGTLLG